MAFEHESELKWRAQELYCVDRLTFERVAEITGVASSTLRRWADFYHWREKRDEIAQAESDIRTNQVLARSKLLGKLMQDGDAQTAFAFNALESLTLKREELVASGKLDSPAMLPARPIETRADVVAALRETIQNRLQQLATRKEALKDTLINDESSLNEAPFDFLTLNIQYVKNRMDSDPAEKCEHFVRPALFARGQGRCPCTRCAGQRRDQQCWRQTPRRRCNRAGHADSRTGEAGVCRGVGMRDCREK